MKVWSHIHTILSKGEPCALVSITKIEGSSPRDTGARMVIKKNGGFHGTIGGGSMEYKAIEIAQKMIEKQGSQLHQKKYILGPDLGQCCGGTVEILTEVFTPERIKEISLFKLWEDQGPFSTYGEITDDRVIRSLEKNGSLIETFGEVRYPLYIFGAGHVGRALMLTLAPLPFDVTWIDSRTDIFPTAMPSNFTPVHSTEPQTLISTAPEGAYILILTHDHNMDFEITDAAIRANRFAYIGLIGSNTKGARFRSKLKKTGLSPKQVNMMNCPIGIKSISSKKPAAIAISVAADLLSRIKL